MAFDGKTRLFGILGHPVSHSLSPAMQNAAFQFCGLNNVYVAFDVTDVPKAINGIRALGIGGASVTIPHKQAIIPLLDVIDPVAEKIGAVNTLVNKEGIIHGYNTDWIGANKALGMVTDLTKSTVLLLGAGGAARAIGFGLQEKGATVILANRTISKGQALAKELNCKFCPLPEVDTLQVDTLVNTTSVGMTPNIDNTPVPQTVLENISAVMDIVYAPAETRLLREAKEVGCKTVNGTFMLLFQGVAQFELWTGHKAPVDVMQEKLLSRL